MLLEYYPDEAALAEVEASSAALKASDDVAVSEKAAALAEEKEHWYLPEPSMARALHFKESNTARHLLEPGQRAARGHYEAKPSVSLDAVYEAKRTTRLYPNNLPAWLLLA